MTTGWQTTTRFASRRPQWFTIEVCPRRPYSWTINAYRIERRDYSDAATGIQIQQPSTRYYSDEPPSNRTSASPRNPALRVSTQWMVFLGFRHRRTNSLRPVWPKSAQRHQGIQRSTPLYRDWWSRFPGVPTVWKTSLTLNPQEPPTIAGSPLGPEFLHDDAIGKHESAVGTTLPYSSGKLQSVGRVLTWVHVDGCHRAARSRRPCWTNHSR